MYAELFMHMLKCVQCEICEIDKNNNLGLFHFSEIASGKMKNFEKDQDFLVLSLDMTKFDMHNEAVKIVLDHFGQVWLQVKFYAFFNVIISLDTVNVCIGHYS